MKKSQGENRGEGAKQQHTTWKYFIYAQKLIQGKKSRKKNGKQKI